MLEAKGSIEQHEMVPDRKKRWEERRACTNTFVAESVLSCFVLQGWFRGGRGGGSPNSTNGDRSLVQDYPSSTPMSFCGL